MKQNNPCYLFGMYEPNTDSVIINAINDTYTGTPLIISCEKCNSAVSLDTPDDIAYLYRLAQNNPEYYGSNVPLFRRNGYRQSGVMIP